MPIGSEVDISTSYSLVYNVRVHSVCRENERSTDLIGCFSYENFSKRNGNSRILEADARMLYNGVLVRYAVYESDFD